MIFIIFSTKKYSFFFATVDFYFLAAKPTAGVVDSWVKRFIAKNAIVFVTNI